MSVRSHSLLNDTITCWKFVEHQRKSTINSCFTHNKKCMALSKSASKILLKKKKNNPNFFSKTTNLVIEKNVACTTIITKQGYVELNGRPIRADFVNGTDKRKYLFIIYYFEIKIKCMILFS